MMELLVIVIWMVAALSAALFLIFGLFAATSGIRLAGETRALQAILILVTIGATILPAAIRISIGLDADDPRLLVKVEGTAITLIWVKRFVTVATLVLAFTGLLRVYRRLLSPEIAGRRLLLAYLLFVLSSFIVGALFSTIPALVPQLYYPLFVLLYVLLSDKADIGVILSTARNCLGLVVIGSLVLTAIPTWGFAMPGSSLIPGLPGRLVGITSHPNVLGPLSLLYILLATAKPFRNQWLHNPMVIAASMTYLLAQSKTAWIAGVLGLTVLVLYRFLGLWQQPAQESSSWIIAGFASKIAGIATLGIATMIALAGVLPTNMVHHTTITQLTTLSGRSQIWDITLGLWEKNPWFGYGPTIWSLEFRAQRFLLFAGQAHNQFFQTLGDSGLVGLVGLAAYLIAIARTAVQSATSSRGISLAVAALFLTRCITESPVHSMGVSDPTFLMHFVTVIAFLYWCRQLNIPHAPKGIRS